MTLISGNSVRVIQPGQNRTRKTRMPSFALQGGFAPQGLYPYFFTPVLPGETLDMHSLKATVVSAPLTSPLAGAWMETWLFYVRLTDIDPALSEMFIGNTTDPSTWQADADRPFYFTKNGQLDWCKLATERIHEIFFLDEDNTAVMHPDGVPMIKRIGSDPFESAVHDETAPTDGAELGDTEGEPISAQLYAFMKMREMGMGITSYEDYLKQYGVPSSAPAVNRGEPELLAYRRYWTLPSNAIDPETGTPTGAWYWRLDEKNEKNKRFSEPGFVIGLWAVRPKWLDGKQAAPYSSSIWGFEDWIPAYALDDPSAGLRKIDVDDQPWITETGSTASDIWIDHRDLLTQGEQFVNGGGRYTAPKANYRQWENSSSREQLRGYYVLPADLENLWSDHTVAKDFDYDGICSLKIKGHVTNET